MPPRDSTGREPTTLTLALLSLGLAGALLSRSPPRADTATDGVNPILAIVMPGPEIRDLEEFGLLSLLTERSAASPPWVLSELVSAPGARDGALWQRATSGLPGGPLASQNRIVAHGFTEFGQWLAPPSVESDRRQLELARQALATHTTANRTLLVLGCSGGVREIGRALAAPDCRAVLEDAITLVLDAARQGGIGMLLLLPPRGFPVRGSFFASGPMVARGEAVRFDVMDLAPTLIHLTGAPLPLPLIGRPGYALLESSFLFHHPVHWVGGGS